MTLDLTLLQRMFDSLPEAVFVLDKAELFYCNPSGRALLSDGEITAAYFIELLPEENGELVCTVQGTLFHISVSLLDTRRLLLVRPVREQEAPGASIKIPAQLRLHLTALSATTERLAIQLSQQKQLDPYRDLLRIQTQAACRILRLARQLELSNGQWEQEYPKKAVDFATLCRRLAEELYDRMNGEGPQFAFQMDTPSLILAGNRALLEQLLLSLLSNALKSAGTDGRVEVSLHSTHSRVVLSIWDSGQSIPDDRLLQLFSPQNDANIPQPNEGVGLDLWIAHRIAMFHSGVIMAANRPGGGTEFTISLPLSPPTNLELRSCDTQHLQEEVYSPLLIALSDALPHKLYDPLEG